MTADVYAGDDALRDAIPAPPPQTGCCYVITADADPDVLCRIANQLLYANVAPWGVVLERDGAQLVRLQIELHGIGPAIAESIRRKLVQLTCVIDVECRRASGVSS